MLVLGRDRGLTAEAFGPYTSGAAPRDGDGVQIDVVPADVAHRRLVIAVQDNGGWKRPEIQTVDGLGLLLMDNLGEDLWIDGQADGTTVIVTVPRTAVGLANTRLAKVEQGARSVFLRW